MSGGDAGERVSIASDVRVLLLCLVFSTSMHAGPCYHVSTCISLPGVFLWLSEPTSLRVGRPITYGVNAPRGAALSRH